MKYQPYEVKDTSKDKDTGIILLSYGQQIHGQKVQ